MFALPAKGDRPAPGEPIAQMCSRGTGEAASLAIGAISQPEIGPTATTAVMARII